MSETYILKHFNAFTTPKYPVNGLRISSINFQNKFRPEAYKKTENFGKHFEKKEKKKENRFVG